jgi:ribosomal protein S17
MKIKVLPYKVGSKSARELVNSLNPLAIMKKQYTPLVGRSKVVLNWGNSSPRFNLGGAIVLNKPDAVANASNKLTAFKYMKDGLVNIPEFTNDIEVAKQWIIAGSMVLCRTLLNSNSGKGIVIAKESADLVSAPLYVKYIKKEKEYRVHVFNGNIIDFIEKKRKSGFQQSTLYNKYIRSYEQGWVFTREGVVLTDEVKKQALLAVKSLGLDFGAVDIVVSNDNNKAVVLEVNTAPGIMGKTLDSYKKAVIEWSRTLRYAIQLSILIKIVMNIG